MKHPVLPSLPVLPALCIAHCAFCIPDAAADGLADRYAGEIRFVEDGRERPAISNGTFRLGGRPVFFVGPWIYNDTRKDWPPQNPDPQGVGHFAYREPPGKDVFERIGFNASQLSAAWSLPGQALYGLDVPEDWRGQEAEKAGFFGRFGDQPMVVDFAFGFAGALKKQRPELAREIDQRTPHWHEFVPFCPESPDGDRYYRAYLKGGAVSALRGGANVFLWELFNESSYQCRCPSNAVAFAKEMEAAFGSIEAANRTWGTSYADFGAVAAETDFFRHARLWPDYAKFLARRYAAVLRDYAEFVRSVDGRRNVYFTEQSSVSSIEKERDACMDYRLVADALDVLAYEGGFPFGRSGAEIVGAGEMEDVVFDKAPGHFFDLDLYRALARRDRKPMVNDELYCQRIESGLRVPSRREDLATVLWAELFHGSSGAFAYCWAKRAWEWKDLDGARRMVEKPSYKSAHLLNPYAWPPEALDGFRLFRDELEPFRDRILDVPRTRSDEAPSVAVVFSYPTVRMLGHVRMDYRERLQRWHGAVLGAHYPVQVVFEEDLPAGLPPSVRALVVPSARFATPEGAAAASRLAESGVTVVADNDAFLADERGDPLPCPSSKIIRLDADSDASVAPLLAALAASGARRDATLMLENTGRPPRGSDVQVIDRGDFKLLFFVAFGEDATQGGILRWNIADGGAFYLSDPIHGRLLLNGTNETWNAASLSNGVFVAVPPQERALFILSRNPPIIDFQARSADLAPRSGDLPARSADLTLVDAPAMRAIVDADRVREAPALAEFARRAAEAAAAHDAARRWPDVDASRCTPVPIAGSANMAFADEVAGDGRGGWFDQGSNDFASMPLGRHILAGVPFEIADPATSGGRAAIVLFGTNRDFFPDAAPEIPVGRKARRLYFLHGYGWDETPGTPVLTYRIRYADGATADFVCRAKAEIGPWHGSFAPSDAKLAVESSNPVLGTVNVQCARWENPRPDVEILGIEPISARSAAVPAVVAITAER